MVPRSDTQFSKKRIKQGYISSAFDTEALKGARYKWGTIAKNVDSPERVEELDVWVLKWREVGWKKARRVWVWDKGKGTQVLFYTLEKSENQRTVELEV